MNYYRDFRQAFYDQRKAKMGEFDPMSTVVYLDESVAQFLRASAGGEGTGIESVGSPTVSAFCTYLHEMLHWWQHVGSTAGFFYSLSIAIQAICTTGYLIDTGTRLRKPLVDAISTSDRNDPAVLAVARWSEIEHACSLLLWPSRANQLLQVNPRFFSSLGESLLLFQISTVAGLSRIFDQDYRGLPCAKTWLDLLEDFVKSERQFFLPYQLFEVPVGMGHIMEGQARLIELQYRTLAVSDMSYSEAKERSFLSGVYSVAFEFFLQATGLPTPADFDEASVNLFLLVCDIALNPSAGYPDDIDPRRDFVRDYHPGMRFVRLCDEVKQCHAILDEVEKVGRSSYLNASQRLCSKLKWADPVSAAERCLAAGRKMTGYAQMRRQFEECDFGAEHVPVRFYMGSHLEFLERKIECPHFFCWPARFLAITKGQEQEAFAFQAMLSWSAPPFVTSSFKSGVDATNLEFGDPQKRHRFGTNYFATIALYDMVRQWISNRGKFRFDYSWKESFSESDQRTLGQQFEKSFGFSHEAIPV
jgi:hypothetical protein